MSKAKQAFRQQLLNEAEGYLDLILVFVDRWKLATALRDRLAYRALDCLNRIDWPEDQQGEVFYLKGQAYRAMERYRQAVPLLQTAAQFEPFNVPVWLALGWCYKRMNRLDLAIESLEEASEVDSEQAIIQYNLACYWSLAGNVDQAVFYLSRAFDIDINFRNLVSGESDFDPIRSEDEFRMLNGLIV